MCLSNRCRVAFGRLWARRRWGWWLACGLMILGAGLPAGANGPRFGDAPPTTDVTLMRFAVHPLHNPHLLAEAYQPLIERLNQRLPGVRLELEASRDYAGFEAKVRQAAPEFILPNPWQTLQAMKGGYHVIAMAGEPADFKGLLLVRRDRPLRHLADLRGQTISYPSPTALAACIMPQQMLHAHGLQPGRDVSSRYVGSQESSIMNVYLGQTAAGATWPPPWRAFQKSHPQEAAALRVAWETPSLVNNSVMVRNDVPPAVATVVRQTLLELDKGPAGRAILAGMQTARFLPASDADYAPVRRYIERFEREVRPVEVAR